MGGLQDVTFAKMSALGMSQFHTIMHLKILKKLIYNLNIDSLNWDDKHGKKP